MIHSGRPKTAIALVASIDVVLKHLHSIRRPNIETSVETSAPIVLMIVPTHKLVEPTYADIMTSMTSPESGLGNCIEPLAIHESIPRPTWLVTTS